MSKKTWSLLSLLLIAAMMLSACRQAEATTPAPVAETEVVMEETEVVMDETEVPDVSAEPVTITVWHQWDGKYLEAIEAAFAKYEETHPNVTIDLSKPDDVANSLNVAIPAGEGPDIIGWANDKIGEQALTGNIVPLEGFGVDMAFLEGTYEPAAVAGVVWQDEIWALPESQEGIALVYNKDLVTEEYLPTDPMDFEDLLAKATKFQEDTGKVLVCNQGFGGSDAYHVAPIFFGHGVPTYIDDEGNVFLDTPESVAAMDWLAKFSEVSLAENSYDICNASLIEGEVGMWWTGPWAVAGIEEAGVNYGILPMGKPFVGIKTLMLTQNAVDRGNAEVAVDIMKFFTSGDVQTEIALVNKTIPAPTAALQDPGVAALPAVIGFGEALNLGVPMANTPYAGAQWGPVGDAAVAVWTGAQTPAEAMAAAQAAAEDAVSQMK